MSATVVIDREILGGVFSRLGDELAHWASSAKILEDAGALGADSARSSALQQFDALNQHLRQLSDFTLRLATLIDGGSAFDARGIRAAATAGNLASLADRLSGESGPARAISAGDCDLW